MDSSDKKAIADRFFNLHIQIAINRLKLTQALPTLRRVHELRSSYKMEVATAESHFSSDVIIKMLFDYLKDCINTENSEDKLSSWYDLFIEIVSSHSITIISFHHYNPSNLFRHYLRNFFILIFEKVDRIWQLSCGYVI